MMGAGYAARLTFRLGRRFSTFIRPEYAPNTLEGATLYLTLESVQYAVTLVREQTESMGAKFIGVEYFHDGKRVTL